MALSDVASLARADGVAARPGKILTRLGKPAIGLIVPAVIFTLWTLSARYEWVPIQILPPPSDVWRIFQEQIASGELAANLAVSFYRVLLSFAIGATLGVALGIALGLSDAADDYLTPLLMAIAQVPTLGWIPLVMLLVGIGEAMKIIVLVKVVFIPVLLNTRSGIRGVSPQLVEVGRAFQFTSWQLISKIVLPGAVPSVFTGIRYGLTQGWMALVAVEMLAASSGIGYMLSYGRQMFWLDNVIVAIITIGVVGYAMDFLLTQAERRLLRWQPRTQTSGGMF